MGAGSGWRSKIRTSLRDAIADLGAGTDVG